MPSSLATEHVSGWYERLAPPLACGGADRVLCGDDYRPSVVLIGVLLCTVLQFSIARPRLRVAPAECRHTRRHATDRRSNESITTAHYKMFCLTRPDCDPRNSPQKHHQGKSALSFCLSLTALARRNYKYFRELLCNITFRTYTPRDYINITAMLLNVK